MINSDVCYTLTNPLSIIRSLAIIIVVVAYIVQTPLRTLIELRVSLQGKELALNMAQCPVTVSRHSVPSQCLVIVIDK